MLRMEILEMVKEFKEKYAKKYGILLIGVFGSVARDDMTEKSDVDIVVQMETPDPFTIVHIKEHLEQMLHVHVDIVRLRSNMNSFLLKRIEKEAVYV